MTERVEWVVVDRNGHDTKVCTGSEAARDVARRWNDATSTSVLYARPYRVIKRTITEEVVP
jgi:hypothetical protein